MPCESIMRRINAHQSCHCSAKCLEKPCSVFLSYSLQDQQQEPARSLVCPDQRVVYESLAAVAHAALSDCRNDRKGSERAQNSKTAAGTGKERSQGAGADEQTSDPQSLAPADFGSKAAQRTKRKTMCTTQNVITAAPVGYVIFGDDQRVRSFHWTKSRVLLEFDRLKRVKALKRFYWSACSRRYRPGDTFNEKQTRWEI